MCYIKDYKNRVTIKIPYINGVNCVYWNALIRVKKLYNVKLKQLF